MLRGRHTRGFTLTEVMIVTTLIAMLAMMSTAAVQRLSKHAEGSAFWNDGRVFAEAFGRHAQERGSYPVDQTATGEVPVGMGDYLRTTNWLRITPLGGHYEWDNKDATNSLGVVFNAAIKVTGCTWTMENLQRLDRLYDDGNLSTGNIIVTDAGTTVFFVIERRPT